MQSLPRCVSALLGALNFQNADQEKLHTLTDGEWSTLLSYCDLMRLTLVLQRLGNRSLPDWVRLRLERNLIGNRERFARTKTAYGEIASALQATDVEHVVLKGFAQWTGSVDAGARMQGDLDLYIPADSIHIAREALLRLDYHPLRGFDRSPSDHLPAMTRKNNWKWRGDYFDPDIPLSVDLHFRFWDEINAGFGPLGLDAFWPRRIRRTIADLNFQALHPADSLAYASLHALRHLLHGTMSVNNIYEIAQFLHTYETDADFWNSWHESHDASLRRLQAVCFRLARDWFNCSVSDVAQAEIQGLSTEVNRWCSAYGESSLTLPFCPNKDALWLHLTLAEPSHRSTIFFKALFPSRFPTIDAVEEQSAKLKGTDNKLSRPITYISHLARRAIHHARILPQTLFHAVGWWWTSKELGQGFLTFLGASFFYTFGMFIYFFLFNLYLIDLGYKEKFVGWTTGALALGGILGILPAGFLNQRFGIRKGLLICFTFVPAISIVRAFLTGEAWQLILASCTGALAAIWGVTISPALAQLTTEKNRPFGFSLVFSSGIGVGVLGGIIGGRLPGWLAYASSPATSLHAKQSALLIACAFMTLAVWPASRLRFTSPPPPEKNFYRTNPFLLRYLPAIAIWSLATGAFTPFFNVYFSQHLRVPVEKIGLYFSGAQFFQVVAILLAPILFRRCGIILGIIYMQIATALSLGCLATLQTASTAGLIYAGYAAFQWMSEPGMYSLLMNQVTPAERSGASAMNALVISSSQALAAVVAGAALARFGYTLVLEGVALMALIAALAFRILLFKSVPFSAPTAALLRPATESSSAHD